MKKGLEQDYELKTEVLGPTAEDTKQVKVLNRIPTWTCIEYEADPRHAGLVVKELKLTESKGVVRPGTKDEGTTQTNKDDLLPERQAG